MIAVTSPAKTQDFETQWSKDIVSKPAFLTEADELNTNLQKKSRKQLQKLMKINSKLADLNYGRFQEWQKNHTNSNSKPAILAYKGDIYREFDSTKFTKSEAAYIQDHLLIITGFYGVMRPYDLMQPYRLEMKIKLSGKGYKDLYDFWGDKITEFANQQLKNHPDKVLVNLASKEYFKAIRPDKLDGKVLQIEFRQKKDGEIKNMGIYSKRARGTMIKFMVENQITRPQQLEGFNLDGYKLHDKNESELVFLKNVD